MRTKLILYSNVKRPVILLLLSALAAIATGQTLLNPDFEQPDTAFTSGLHGWRANRQYETGRDTQIRHAGRSSVYLKSIPGKTFGAFSQMVTLPARAAVRKYRVSGYIKRDAVEQFTGIWINVFEGETSLFFDNMQARNLNGTADWMEVATEFFVEETANEIQIGGLLVGPGRVWFDSFAITETPVRIEQVPDSLRTYLTEALDRIQQNALHRDSVNWSTVRERALLMVSGQTSYASCYPAIRYALSKLKDHHSFLMDATATTQWSQPDADAFRKMPLTTGEMLGGKIALLEMPPVSSGSEALNTYFADQLQHLLDSLDRMRPQGWILDLRGNPGGLLHEAVNIVNVFTPKGQLVVNTHGKVTEWDKTYHTLNAPVDTEIPLVVLTSKNSASASEIVAGSIQDLDRGVVVGQKSFGKGLVQSTRPLSFNTQLKVTTAKYYIPSGRCIQLLDYSHRNADGSVASFADSLKKEFKTKGGRKVYDGGGVSPDMAVDARVLSPVAQSLINKLIIFDYASKYRSTHASIPAVKNFSLSDADFQDFLNFIKGKEYDYNTKTEQSLEEFKKKAQDEKYFDAIKNRTIN